MTEPRRLLSALRVSERIGKSVRTVQRMAESGELPAVKLDGQTGSYVFEEEDIQRWEDANSAKADR